jgi:hypothetical protein
VHESAVGRYETVEGGRNRLRIQLVDATHYDLSNQRSVANETSDPLHGGPEG